MAEVMVYFLVGLVAKAVVVAIGIVYAVASVDRENKRLIRKGY